MDIKKIEKEQRPRERLIRLGAESLSNHELLAIMLGSGSKEKSVLDLSLELIENYGLYRLCNMEYMELKKIKGIKEAKASKLMACFELAKRCMWKASVLDVELLTAKAVYDYVYPEYAFLGFEQVMALFVNPKCRVIHKMRFTSKISSKAELPIREIVQSALSLNAYGIFLIHNHPTGDVNPSRSDFETTKKFYKLLYSIHILLLDHIILGRETFFSFEENHLLNFSEFE